MAERPYTGFVGPSYTSQSRVGDAERCVNWYVERPESPNAKSRAFLYPTPGATLRATAPELPGRAFAEINGRVFAVIGSTFYELDAIYALTARGTVLVDDQPATIQSNGDVGDQVFVTSGGAGYLFTLSTNTFAAIPALATGADQGAYLDGYFLSLARSTSTLRISDLADGSVWPPLQATQRTSAPDRWQSGLISNRDLWLFGAETTDVWQDTGAFPFPFEPIPGATLQWGTPAPFSPCVVGAPIWLAASRDGTALVLRATGYTAQRVSTYAVEYALSRYVTLADAIGWTYQLEGHAFYVLSFPTAGATWVYDVGTGLWHVRMYWEVRTARERALRQQWHVFAFGQHLVLDREGGGVYSLSNTDGFDVAGAAIRRVRRAPHLQAVGRPLLFLNQLELDLENGLGLPVGQGSDPQIVHRLSTDGARTWGNERWTSAGPQGAYTPRVQWQRLGSGRDLVSEVIVSDPTPWRVIGASVDIEAGRF